MKSRLFLLTAIFVMYFPVAFPQKTVVSSDQKMNVFIDDLMKKMTLEEKI